MSPKIGGGKVRNEDLLEARREDILIGCISIYHVPCFLAWKCGSDTTTMKKCTLDLLPNKKKLCMCIDLSACDRFGGERQNKSTRRRKQSMRRLENGSYRKQINMKMKTTKLRHEKNLLAVQFYFLTVPQPMMAHF